MAAEALATDWRAHLTDTVGFHSGQDATVGNGSPFLHLFWAS